MDDWVKRAAAMLLGVIHHGLGNLAKQAIPAKPGTVIHTSSQFYKYIDTGEVPPREQ